MTGLEDPLTTTVVREELTKNDIAESVDASTVTPAESQYSEGAGTKGIIPEF